MCTRGVGGTIQLHRPGRWRDAEGEQDDWQINEEMGNDHEHEIAPPQLEAEAATRLQDRRRLTDSSLRPVRDQAR